MDMNEERPRALFIDFERAGKLRTEIERLVRDLGFRVTGFVVAENDHADSDCLPTVNIALEQGRDQRWT